MYGTTNKQVAVCLLLLLTGLTACSDADTLGDEPPREVVINGAPTWENGIGELVQLKCGYCHAVPRPPIAPENIVTDLDLNTYDTRIVDGQVIRGADSIGRWIYDGILDQAVPYYDDTSQPRQMPLDYGTPLTEAEKGLLLTWSEAGAPRNAAGEPPPGDKSVGLGLYFQGCDGCHNIGDGLALDENTVFGPALRPAAVTQAKIKSMWLERINPSEPLSDDQAAALQAYILEDLLPNLP
ncbi:cytochrome c [Acanthopleuribacter pedis]|uniref:Cytochrome c n=1 Tax=Acanthopleuribacter pedis TaxID=442870 RepID=A0A8J7U3K6_9BACT|nr:cytochrome c [Acanthopleuribacter pedis]MBO1320523.1 cytochrome c [Acanthopleuribacter pedis]